MWELWHSWSITNCQPSLPHFHTPRPLLQEGHAPLRSQELLNQGSLSSWQWGKSHITRLHSSFFVVVYLLFIGSPNAELLCLLWMMMSTLLGMLSMNVHIWKFFSLVKIFCVVKHLPLCLFSSQDDKSLISGRLPLCRQVTKYPVKKIPVTLLVKKTVNF